MDNLQSNQDNQLTTRPQPSGVLDIQNSSEKHTKIGKQIYHVNQLTPYPLTAGQIFDWTRSVVELLPEATPEQIKNIIDQMKLGEIEYDSRVGIQNIFRAYRETYQRGLVH